MKSFAFGCLLASACALETFDSTTKAVPTAIFHGLGDQCKNGGMENFTKEIADGTQEYAACIEIGNGAESSFFMNMEKQAETACKALNEDSHFDGEFNVAGLSQGGLIARYIVESCEMKGNVRNFLSIGGPQMGVSDVPGCFKGPLCRGINYVVRKIAYFKEVQEIFGPAGYFRSPRQMKKYLEDSVFLPYVNNEKGDAADMLARKTRFAALNGLMPVMFTEDSVVYPKESEWFQSLNKTMKVQPLEKSDWYNSDAIGLKTLNEAGKVQFIKIDGDHLQFSAEDITNTFIPFLLS